MSNLLEKINTEKRTPLVLSDYIKIKHGFAFKGEYFSNQPTSNILVTPGNFAIGGGFKADKFKYYKGAIPEDYVLKENDLVITMTDLSVDADTLGYSALIPDDEKKTFLHNQRVGLVQKKKEGIDFGYLYYLMRTRPYQKYVVSTATGSTVKHTSPDRIANYEYDFPILSTQKKIAEILSAYDAKIENNNFIIKKLEATAQTLFDEWFVNFKFPGHEKVKMVDSEMEKIPEGWKVGKVSDLGNIVCGKTPSKSHAEYFGGNIPFIKIPDMHDQVFINTTEDSLTEAGENTQKNKTVPAGSICVSCIATVGLVSITTQDSQTNQQINTLVPNSEELLEYLYFTLVGMKSDLQAIGSGGSTTLNVNTSVFSGLETLIPNKEVVKEFHRVVSKMFDEIKQLTIENVSLRSQRDRLLIKLI